MKLSTLHPLVERPGPWASVYVPVVTADESTLRRRDLRARHVQGELRRMGADEGTRRVVDDALSALADERLNSPYVLFAADGDLVCAEPLAEGPPGDAPSVWWSRLPRLTPLLEYAHDEPDCLVAYVDRAGADIELRTPAGRRPVGEVEGKQWPLHRTASADWSERHFQLKVENTWEENAKAIAHALASCQEQTGAELLVLAGDVRERSAVHAHLPAQGFTRVGDSEHGGRARGADGRLLDEDVNRIAADHARHRTDGLLDRFGDGGDGMEHLEALVEAAREHRVATLLVRHDGPDAAREVWTGTDPDQLALRRTDAAALGAEQPFAARADDALLRSAVATGADAVLVPADSAHPVGGLGALPRWTYS